MPATGGAAEELVRPDQDETDDALINREMNKVTEFAEVPAPDLTSIYRSTPPVFRKDKHLFRFFIDGSFKTYFLGTGVEGNRSFPIELAQIGGAVIHRMDDGSLKVHRNERKLLLLLPQKERGISDSVWAMLERLTRPDFFEIQDYAIPDPLSKDHSDARDKAGGKVRFRTHRMEWDLIQSTEGLRDKDSWLILDGAVKLEEFVKAPYVIGVAKAFNKNPQFQFGAQTQARDITAVLANLPHCHRTVAFKGYNGKVAFWYVRMREQKDVDYPLMGVVKVELPRPDESPVEAEFADEISRALVAERSVCPYGLDKRWHCCIYPIHIAEQVIKKGFFSQEVLLGAIKWPKR